MRISKDEATSSEEGEITFAVDTLLGKRFALIFLQFEAKLTRVLHTEMILLWWYAGDRLWRTSLSIPQGPSFFPSLCMTTGF